MNVGAGDEGMDGWVVESRLSGWLEDSCGYGWGRCLVIVGVKMED